MQITVQLPDDLESRPGGEREALEAFVIQGLRDGVFSKVQGCKLLGMHRFQMDGFIKKHQIERFAYNEEDFARDMATLEKLHAKELAKI
jgi:predicted HTH domain antitoxin